MAKKGKRARADRHTRPAAEAAPIPVEEKTAIKPAKAPKAKKTPQDAPRIEISDKTWRYCSYCITALAAVLRFIVLDIKPFHHDEGVNGFFLTNLLKDANYHYDPANYHGPTLYFMTLPFAEIFGLNTIPVRLPMAIIGVLTVVLVFYLRRYLGNIGTLFAALFVALSPGLVFISRYFIHETFFIFLTFAMAVAITMFIEQYEAGPGAVAWMSVILWTCLTPSAVIVGGYLGGEGADHATAVWVWRIVFLALDAAIVYFVMRSLLTWDDGRPIYVLLAAACLALNFATKETGFITMGTMVIACLAIYLWRRIAPTQFLGPRLFISLAVFHVIAGLTVLYYGALSQLCITEGTQKQCYSIVSDGVKFLYNDLIKNQWRPPEYFVFYCLLFVIAMTLIVWFLYVSKYKRARETYLAEPLGITPRNFRDALGEGIQPLIIAAASVALFVYLFTLFFTSFFTYKEGFWKAFEAYAIWAKTGNKEHAFNGTWAYLKWCMKLEGPIMAISVIGLLVSVIKAKHRWAMFAGLWAWGLFAAYTIIPYKTPWLAISFILPMCLAAGYAIGEMLDTRDKRLRTATWVLIAASLALLCYQTFELNFVRYDDDQMGYVYAHTKHGYKDMIAKIDYYAQKSGKGYDAQIEIVSPDYWPMTWDLNKYGHAYFQGRLVDATTAEMIVTKKGEQDAQVVPKYSDHYKFAGYYPLRPGVDLCILVRSDLADPDAQDLSKILTLPALP